MTGNFQIFFDQSIKNLTKVYIKKYPDILYPGKLPLKVKSRTKDTQWLKVAGRRNWVCITKDNKILYKPRERKSLYYNRARLIVLMDVMQENRFVLERMVNHVWKDIPEWFYRYDPPWVVQVFLTERGIYHRIMSGPELRKEWNIP